MYKIELLSDYHSVETFDCGDEAKNRFLARFALQNSKGGLGRTYVAVRPAGGETIHGYYTISSSSVKFDNLPPSRLPKYPIPAILIGKLAVDIRSQHRGLAKVLLQDALKRALAVAEEVGVFLVEIKAVNDTVRDFYVKRGFREMLDDPLKLYMSVKTIRSLVSR